MLRTNHVELIPFTESHEGRIERLKSLPRRFCISRLESHEGRIESVAEEAARDVVANHSNLMKGELKGALLLRVRHDALGNLMKGELKARRASLLAGQR